MSTDSLLRDKMREPSPSPPPVTPGVLPSGMSAYLHVKAASQGATRPTADENATPGPRWNANAFFETDDTHRPSSPTDVAKNARSGEDLLKRLSLPADYIKKDTLKDPRAEHPNLNLTGRLISATFCVPFNVKFQPDRDWTFTPRNGSSALFDSFSFLSSSSSPWKHLLLGWTGEISESPRPLTFAATDNFESSDLAALIKASAPVPVKPVRKAANKSEGIKVGRPDRARLEKQLAKGYGGNIVPVWLVDEVDEDTDVYIIKDQRRWSRFAENDIYSTFHYKQNEPADGRAMRKAWLDYYHMNRCFAEKILEIYQPGDVVVVHDYQLLLLPTLLRQKLPAIYVGFFLHVPFPSSEVYRCLSRRREILEGILGSNMIGFQNYGYSRHFSSCCTRILGFESSSAGVDAYGAHVAVDVFPVGINAASTRKAAFEDKNVDNKVAAIKKLYQGKRIIVGRDRLHSIRGVAQKLQAFSLFLERYPQWRDKVVLIQITNSSERNKDRDDEKTFVNKVADLVAKINGRYGTLSFSPVQHFPQYLAREEYFALLRAADIGLITSVRDGMNTTSLEYVLCQKDNHGPLILSEFSGTAGSLSHAIHVNPWDLGDVANAINNALTMPAEERLVQHRHLYEYVTQNNVQAWTNAFLSRLLTNLSSFDQSFATPTLDRAKLLSRYRAARKRLFMFDYDGTLTPIVKDPQNAIPSDRVIRTLKTLASDNANSVWIISGRDQAFLDEWFGHISELGLSAEHGSFMRYPRTEHWENVAAEMDMSWRQEVKDVFTRYTERTQGSFVEIKKIALTWHYRRADPDYGAFQARECQRELEAGVVRHHDVEVMTGKANLEVRPRFVNKGEISKKLIEGYITTASATSSSLSTSHPAPPPDPPTAAHAPPSTTPRTHPSAPAHPTQRPSPTTAPSTSRPRRPGAARAAASTSSSSSAGPEFVLCLGDDFTDEDMFRALRASRLHEECVFSVAVGASSKQTLARWHLLEPADVIAVVGLLNGGGGGGGGGGGEGIDPLDLEEQVAKV